VWGLGPEFIHRFSIYNSIILQPFNKFAYNPVPAAWNNPATNAGDASIVYISGFVDFDLQPELVLTVPPTTSMGNNQYYVVAYYDGYGNTIGSPGTRTTPFSGQPWQAYLLVGPNSKYAKHATVRINGFEYRVMASDTNINWFLIRVLANTLVDSSNPIWGWQSVPNIVENVQHQIRLNTLADFEAAGHVPLPPADNFITPPANQEQICRAAPFQNLPTCALEFFKQLGRAVETNPVPKANTGLSGMPASELEIRAPWMALQAGSSSTPPPVYVVPSFGQKAKLDSFKPIGLTKNGFRIPHNWREEQLNALQCGYGTGQNFLKNFIASFPAEACTNYWGILNDPVGTYPNTDLGYLYRSLIVVEGGVANIAPDAVYPTLVSITPTPSPSGTPPPLDGNNTYKITFVLPGGPSPTQSPSPCATASPTANPQWPVSGIIPPMVLDSITGNLLGFWSIHVYATDHTESAAPFIAQTSLQNLHYSTVDTQVISVTPGPLGTITVSNPNWGTIVSSTPILFGDNAADYGLMPNTVYYAVCSENTCPNAGDLTTSTFSVATQWIQPLSSASPPVPIQGPGGSYNSIVALPTPAPGASPLQYGMVKPVTQLGSTQLAANQLHVDNNTLTLWFGPGQGPGGHEPPTGCDFPSNWIPTPNTAYYTPIYGEQISTNFQLTLRMYYPAPNPPPSILPCPAGECMPASYIPPAVECVSGPTCP
jgi:hypothetical protein